MNQIEITWKAIHLTIKQNQILNNCSGCAKKREVLGIMGPSGAGKTTLIGVLANKIQNNKHTRIQGQVKANTQNYTEKQFNNWGSYVFQNDILFQTLTVKQSLFFAAKMRMQGTELQRENRVYDLINKFQLDKCQDTLIGGQFVKKGISGGQRKRTCVAIQLISNPKVIILDEPTSGLDSFTALLLIKILKNYARQGRTVICTIHQPGTQIFLMLDQLLLMNSGRNIYQGKPEQVINYMQKLDIHMPRKYNPGDFCMQQISKFRQKQGYQTKLNAQQYDKNLRTEIQSYKQLTQIQLQQKQQNSIPFQIFTIYKRAFTNFIRNPMLLGSRIFNLFIVILLLGGIFWKAAGDPPPYQTQQLFVQAYLANIGGLCFTLVTSMIMNGIFSVTLVFPSQREVFSKEASSKTYRVISYFLGKILMQIPVQTIFPIIFGSIVYWMVGLEHNAQKFFFFLLTLILVTLTGNGLGLMVGSIFPDAKRSAALTPMFILPFMIFGGLYTNFNTIPVWISWLQYVSVIIIDKPFKYGFQALAYSQLNDRHFIVFNRQIDSMQELGISMNATDSILILLGVLSLFYIGAFIFLKILSGNPAV